MIDFATLTRPGTPNTYLLAPEGACGQAVPDGPAPVFGAQPDAVFAALRDAVAAMPRVSDVEADEGRRALSFVQRTALMRFKDDVDAMVVSQGGGAALIVYSRSRVGHSDLGANEKRVEALVAAVRERVS